jgi:repressor LexA
MTGRLTGRLAERLSEKQEAVLRFLACFQKEQGFPPTTREVAHHFGFRSDRSARDHLRALERKGYLRRLLGKTRGLALERDRLPWPREYANALPLVGAIAAGRPILAVENLEDTLSIDPAFFSAGECFAVRVQGESMVGKGILDGDIVVIRRQEAAQPGQVVAALIGEEVTLKSYFPGQDRVELRAANPAVPSLVFEAAQAPAVLGVMVGLLRKGS